MKQSDSISETKRQLIRLIELFAELTNREVSTVARWATGSGDTVGRLQIGKGITTDRVDNSTQWLSDNWPKGQSWPVDVPRPKPSKSGRAA